MLEGLYSRLLLKDWIHYYFVGNSWFFGLGLDPESPNWGATINEAENYCLYTPPCLTTCFCLAEFSIRFELVS